MPERWRCPNATPDGEGGFRCGIADRAYQEGLTVLDLEHVTSPIALHRRGIRAETRCAYLDSDSRLQRLCFGSLVSPNGINAWIEFTKRGERQVVLRGNEDKATKIFGPQSIQAIRRALAEP